MDRHSTIADLRHWALQQLKGRVDQPNLEIRLLLREATGLRETHLLAFPEAPVDTAHAEQFRAWVERRVAGEPAAYILGKQEFWSLSLSVNEHTLVPRPETELLVERALALLADGPARVLDLGTGSGAIALALASERPQWDILATDQSEPALAMARSNANRLALPIRFLESCWFEALGAETPFDLIISNPPYIADQDHHLMDGSLRFEPQSALAAGSDGLDDIRQIINQAPPWLRPGGWLLLEHGFDQEAAIRRLLLDSPLQSVTCHRDLAGHARASEARAPSSSYTKA